VWVNRAGPDAERPWDVAHRAPTVARALVERAGLGARVRGSRLDDRYRGAPSEVDGYLSAGCLLVSRAAWRDVGPFDDKRYFLFGEDRDWQAAARARGWRLRLVDEPVRRDGDPGDPYPGAGAFGAEQPRHRIRDLQLATSALGLGRTGRGAVLTAADIITRRGTRPGAGSRHPVVITTPRFGLGGAERQRALLANELARRGHPVTVVCLHDLGYLQRELDPAVRLVFRPWWQPFVDLPDGDAVLVSGTTNIEVGFATVWRRVPGRRRRWLVAAHNPPEAGRTYSAWLARAISRSDGVIALSEGHWGELTHDQHLHTRHWNVPNGVQLHEDRGFAPHRPLRVGFLGRIVEHKNPHVLVAALAELAELDWRLDLFGDGKDLERLRAMVPDAVRDRVHWRGRTAGPGPALAEMDVLCLPSGHEAFPLVLLEAMACGVPTMATAVCAVPDMLDHGRAGVVVAEGSVPAWVAALRPVLTDPETLGKVARAGWERVEALYTVAAMTGGYQEIMKQVLAGPR
jgi:glycosyltransferase involved in cell wall biosynthesis